MKRSNVFATIAVVIVVVAAVGYYASTSLIQQPQPMVPGPKPEPKLTKVTFLLDWKPHFGHSAWYLAVDKGWFKEAGLDVDIVVGQGSSYSVRIIGAGQANFASAAAPTAISGVVKGLSLKTVYMIYQNDPNIWYALPKSGIKSPTDWVGKRVGFQAESVSFIVYQALLKKLGIDRSKLQELPQGFDPLSPLVTDKMDVTTAYRYDVAAFRMKGYPDITAISAIDFGVNPYGNGVIATADYVSKNPEIVRKFVQVTKKAWAYTLDHPGEAIDALRKYVPETSRVLELERLELMMPVLVTDATKKYGYGYMEEERWKQTVDLLYDYGMISSKPDIKDLYANEFLK